MCNTFLHLLQAFVKDIVRGSIRSRRMDYLKIGSSLSLRRSTALVINDDNTVSFRNITYNIFGLLKWSISTTFKLGRASYII